MSAHAPNWRRLGHGRAAQCSHTRMKPSDMDAPPTTTTAQPKRSYFKRHWRGELSLARAFWVNTVLLSMIWLPLLGLQALILAYPPSITTLLVGTALVIVVSLAMGVWQYVGTWRSARHHHARGGRKLWAWVVYALLVLGIVYPVYDIFETGNDKALQAAWQMLRDPNALPPARATLLAPDELAITGNLLPGSAKVVRQQLAAYPAVTRVQLYSNGGMLLEALSIAKLIRQKGLITYTNADCLSACTLIFQAGKERWIGPKGRLGFHSAALYGTAEQSSDIEKMYRQALHDGGYSDAFIKRVLATPPESLWYPDLETLRKERILTGVAEPGSFADLGQTALDE